MMDIVSEGVTSMKMVSRSELSSTSSKTPTTPYAYNWDHDEGQGDTDLGGFLSSLCKSK